MKTILFVFMGVLILAGLSNTALAYSDTSQETCYFFENNKLKNKGNCTVTFGMGGGGHSVHYKYRKKEYLFEYTNQGDDFVRVDGKKDVVRDKKTFKIISEKDLLKFKGDTIACTEVGKNQQLCS